MPLAPRPLPVAPCHQPLATAPLPLFQNISFLGPVWSGLVRFGLVSKFADAPWSPFWSRKGAVMSPQRRPGRDHWQRPENDRKTTGFTKPLRPKLNFGKEKVKKR